MQTPDLHCISSTPCFRIGTMLTELFVETTGFFLRTPYELPCGKLDLFKSSVTREGEGINGQVGGFGRSAHLDIGRRVLDFPRGFCFTVWQRSSQQPSEQVTVMLPGEINGHCRCESVGVVPCVGRLHLDQRRSTTSSSQHDVFVQCGELQDQQAVGAVPGEAVCAGGRDAAISITVSFTTLLSNRGREH